MCALLSLIRLSLVMSFISFIQLSSFSRVASQIVQRQTFNKATAASICPNYKPTTSSSIAVRNMSSSLIVPSYRVKDEKESVWNEFIKLSIEEKPLNLGQGLPDYPDAVPSHVKENLINAVNGSNFMLNQYTRGYGHPRLVNALSKLYSKLINHPINPQEEILVTIGAYESIFCIINAFIERDDEAIIIEPFFDCYEPMVRLAGGKSQFVPLRLEAKSAGDTKKPTTSADWKLDLKELESKINPKTKMLILNTPHNPIGKVFSEQELLGISEICKKNNLLVLSDEVYEHLVIDGKHVRIASLPGMWERTITVGSAGKTFSVTGWKLGWCYGPKELMRYVQLFHQNCIYTCPTPLQEAVANSFEIEIGLMGSPDSYWYKLAQSLRQKRDMTVEFLRKANMEPTVPEGGYFLLADTSSISPKYDFSTESGATKDHKFVRWLTKNKKIQGIPPSAFYSSDHKCLAEDFIRLCYFKAESTLKEAERLITNL